MVESILMPAALEAWRASYCLAWRWRGRVREVRICGFVVRKGCFIFFGGRSAGVRWPTARLGMMARAINALRSKIVPIIADILAVLAGWRRGEATSAYLGYVKMGLGIEGVAGLT